LSIESEKCLDFYKGVVVVGASIGNVFWENKKPTPRKMVLSIIPYN
jgi:hypothetical protein